MTAPEADDYLIKIGCPPQLSVFQWHLLSVSSRLANSIVVWDKPRWGIQHLLCTGNEWHWGFTSYSYSLRLQNFLDIQMFSFSGNRSECIRSQLIPLSFGRALVEVWRTLVNRMKKCVGKILVVVSIAPSRSPFYSDIFVFLFCTHFYHYYFFYKLVQISLNFT